MELKTKLRYLLQLILFLYLYHFYGKIFFRNDILVSIFIAAFVILFIKTQNSFDILRYLSYKNFKKYLSKRYIVLWLTVLFFLVIGLSRISYMDKYKLFIACVYAPIFEELIYRLVIGRYLKVIFKKTWIACLITTVIFTLRHTVQEPQDLISIFIAGLILFISFEKTETIYISMIIHSLWNLIYSISSTVINNT